MRNARPVRGEAGKGQSSRPQPTELRLARGVLLTCPANDPEGPMADVAIILAAALFFAIAIAYVGGCEKL